MKNESTLLHRDISRANILLGDHSAEPGWRGVLIDLDKAWNVHEIPTSTIAGHGIVRALACYFLHVGADSQLRGLEYTSPYPC